MDTQVGGTAVFKMSDNDSLVGTLYEPLMPNSLDIRVLELEPSTDFDSEIRCNLASFDLLDFVKQPDTHSFEAVSYTWGDASVLKHVVVNDRLIAVTTNLNSFLRHRRESAEPAKLWIDAICINQEDISEKEQPNSYDEYDICRCFESDNLVRTSVRG